MVYMGIRKKNKEEFNWVTLDRIHKEKARYNILIGQRSNGKTYACLKYCLEHYTKTGEQFAIIRRMREDFRGRRSQTLFDSLIANGEIRRITNNQYTGVTSYGLKWYFCNFDEDTGKVVKASEPFAYGFALSEMVHDKGTSYPNIKRIIFDEFISTSQVGYLLDEFVTFCNLLSSIIRAEKDDTIIYMLGNTISKYCPYFKEMGLTNIKDLKPGEIQVYEYGEDENPLRVAVQFTDSISKKGKPTDIYFAFNNPKLKMITGGDGQGVWELELFPHNIIKYEKSDIVFRYFIKFEDEFLQADVISNSKYNFTFIHSKNSLIKKPEKDLIFDLEDNQLSNYRKYLNKGVDDITTKIAYYFKIHKVFYQDNEVGEKVQHYINEAN